MPSPQLHATVEDCSDDDDSTRGSNANSPQNTASTPAHARSRPDANPPPPQVYHIIPDNSSIDSGYSSKTAATAASADQLPMKPESSKKKTSVRVDELKKSSRDAARPRSSSVDTRAKTAEAKANSSRPKQSRQAHSQRPQLVTVQHGVPPGHGPPTPASATGAWPEYPQGPPPASQAPQYFYTPPPGTYVPIPRHVPPSPTGPYPGPYMAQAPPMHGAPQPRIRGPSFSQQPRPVSLHDPQFYPPSQPPAGYSPQYPNPGYDYPSPVAPGYPPSAAPRPVMYQQPSPLEPAPAPPLQRPPLGHFPTDRPSHAAITYPSGPGGHPPYARSQTAAPATSGGPFRPPPGRPPTRDSELYLTQQARDARMMPPPSGLMRRPSASRRESVSYDRPNMYGPEFADYDDQDYDDESYFEEEPPRVAPHRRLSTRRPSQDYVVRTTAVGQGRAKTYSERRREAYREAREQPRDAYREHPRDAYDEFMKLDARRQTRDAEKYQAHMASNTRDRATSEQLTQEALRQRAHAPRSHHSRSHSYSRSRTSSGESQEGARAEQGFELRVGGNLVQFEKSKVTITSSDDRGYVPEGSYRSAQSNRHSRRSSAYGVDDVAAGFQHMRVRDDY